MLLHHIVYSMGTKRKILYLHEYKEKRHRLKALPCELQYNVYYRCASYNDLNKKPINKKMQEMQDSEWKRHICMQDCIYANFSTSGWLQNVNNCRDQLPLFVWNGSKISVGKEFYLIIIDRLSVPLCVFSSCKVNTFCNIVSHWYTVHTGAQKNNELQDRRDRTLCNGPSGRSRMRTVFCAYAALKLTFSVITCKVIDRHTRMCQCANIGPIFLL